ncbi:ABC transporter substrate-binding protein [Bradyrhizobium uaiense]|uniref:ABC transporter substrate-binding protein n=1 Tax=Bradyrhizobium uaiense TaxID=2594946 RepID=UPI0032218F38
MEAVGPALPKMRAMVDSRSPEWDVVDAAPGDFLVLSSDGMLQQLDYSAMDRSVFADFPQDAVQPFGVGMAVYAVVIAFNAKKYTQANGPKSWADVWDVNKFPGPRILSAPSASVPPIEAALLADGVPPERLYPLDFKRAYAALSRIKPSVVKWATTAAMSPEAYISGEAVIGSGPHGRIQLAKEQGAPVDYAWDQALTGYTYWAILKGAKNVNNAQKFIEFASRPESQAALAKLFIIGPLNKKAFDLIPADRAKLLPTYPENRAKTISIDPAWWSKKDASGRSNVEINNALWNSWSLQQ